VRAQRQGEDKEQKQKGWMTNGNSKEESDGVRRELSLPRPLDYFVISGIRIWRWTGSCTRPGVARATRTYEEGVNAVRRHNQHCIASPCYDKTVDVVS
jgi:hypothetical protein